MIKATQIIETEGYTMKATFTARGAVSVVDSNGVSTTCTVREWAVRCELAKLAGAIIL